MKRIIKPDAQGYEELMEEIRRTNARRKEIEDESAEPTGRPPTGPVVRMVVLPASKEQGAAAEPSFGLFEAAAKQAPKRSPHFSWTRYSRKGTGAQHSIGTT